jgi:hypothetical protein
MQRSASLGRRGFLTATGFGAAALAGAGGWLAWDSRDASYQAKATGLKSVVLTAAELVILQAVAETMIAKSDRSVGAPSAREARVAERIDRELSFHGGKLLSDVKAALALIERAPLLDLIGTRFTDLPEERQAMVLAKSETSPLQVRRQAFVGLKFLICFFYYSDDRTWASIGYGGPLVPEKPFEGGNRLANLAPTSRSAKAGARS